MKPYTILWENQSLIAVCKAANVSSVADEKDSADLCTQLCAYTGNTVYPVHRLDRMTGGVIVYAKTTAAAAALSAQMKAHTTQKTYLAVVEGVPVLSCATLRHFLFFDRHKGKSYPVRIQQTGSPMRRSVKEAILDYTLCASIATPQGTRSLLRVLLKTGRTHQIRCQLAAVGCPLCGDGKYGAHDKECRCALWAFSLSFTDPESGTCLTLTAPPPDQCPWKLFSDSIQNLSP